MAYIIEFFPEPYVTRDQIEKWSIDDVLSVEKKALRFEDLGIKPERMEEQAYKYLHAFKSTGLSLISNFTLI